MNLEQQVSKLQHGYDGACEDTAAEQGEEVVDGGGWSEIANSILSLSYMDTDISEKARNEFARRNGVERRK